jgi:hypothetical protein
VPQPVRLQQRKPPLMHGLRPGVHRPRRLLLALDAVENHYVCGQPSPCTPDW